MRLASREMVIKQWVTEFKIYKAQKAQVLARMGGRQWKLEGWDPPL